METKPSFLTLIRDKVEKRNRYWYSEYKCACGKIKLLRNDHVKSGNARSCGCKRRALHKIAVTKHGMNDTRIYNIWTHMRKRCRNPKDDKFHNYGGRGIMVCNEWENSFIAFYEWAMKNGYSDELEIDRKNNNGNYEPSNCHWTTKKINAMNRRTNISPERVKEIKLLISKGLSPLEIHKLLGNSQSSIRNISKGKIYSHITI